MFDFSDFLLARVNPDGRLDNSFGDGGRVKADFGRVDKARAVAIQADGKLIAAGYSGERSFDGFDQSDFALARFTGFVFPDYSLSSDSTTINVRRGGKTEFTLTVNRLGEFTGSVGIFGPDVRALKMKLTPATASTTGNSVEFKIKVKKAARRGSHPLIFTGLDDSGRERSLALTITIN